MSIRHLRWAAAPVLALLVPELFRHEFEWLRESDWHRYGQFTCVALILWVVLDTLYQTQVERSWRRRVLTSVAVGMVCGLSWWFLIERRGSKGASTVLPEAVASQDASPPSGIAASAAPGVQPGPVDPALVAAQEAAEHYRRTSPTLKRHEITEAYADICRRIAESFGLNAWAPKNQLTRMVTVNTGDVAPFERAAKELPLASLAAIRITVDFETEPPAGPRPLMNSYVMYGRQAEGPEVIALYDSESKWAVIARDDRQIAEEVIADLVRDQLALLTKRIEPFIRRLK